ncbi:MAG: 2-C-methyl-D-erythritol 4-phosphate cytidylyltransferase, partial [Cyanobacteria bacterium J06639_14]
QGWAVTDDAALFERCGLPVKIVMGEETNLKVTTPDDLKLAEMIVRDRMG